MTVDLRSDTVTRPSAGMRRAIAEAEVGDAVLGDDPTVAELERRGAEMLGKPRALFFPSGIMANQAAILAHAQPGTEAVIEAGGHILNWEDAAAAAWGGVQLRPVPTVDGLLTPDLVEAAIRPSSPFLPRTSLLCLENTHNGAGGRVTPLPQMEAVADVARARSVPVHLDGARLPNAAAALGLSLAEMAGPADTVMMSLSKGIGAPVGSLLAGPDETMEPAWRIRRRMGGGMRQAGLLAAGALWGLEHNLPRIAEDHQRAAQLATAAAQVPGLAVMRPETNIVMIDLADPRLEVDRVLAELERREVLMARFGARRVRAVTHLDIDDRGISSAAAALADAVSGLLCAA